jgi:thiamine-monophosphate kinase
MPNKDKKITQLSELGEFGLIDKLTRDIKINKSSSLKGIGDDAAVLKPNEDEHIVVTTDMLTEGVHFDLIYTPLKHLGYKAVVVNVSDIYAMNATPTQITVSLAVSNKFSAEAIEELYLGIKEACKFYEVDLIGGDTTSSMTGLCISVTAIGSAPADRLCYRNGAQENDIICVTGNLGAAYLGLQVLEREKKVFQEVGNQPELKKYEYVVSRLLKPEARKEINGFLSNLQIKPTSMIDISDGLSSELIHICSQSDKGCKIFREKIPIAEETGKTAEEFGIEPLICALNGGDDYELLFTVPVSEYDKIKGVQGISIIGHITDKDTGMHIITPNGSTVEIKAQGWNSY